MRLPGTDKNSAAPAAKARAGARRFHSLDAWRGIAALFVAAMHLRTLGWINQSALVEHAGRFVDFFFVLSGFVIAYAYRERLEHGWTIPFLLRRIGRLWPLQVATLIVLVVMASAGSWVGLHVSGFTASSIPANLTLTHSWGFIPELTWNGPSWSISTEMFAYALFALLAWGFRGRALDAVCAGILAGALAVRHFLPLEVIDPLQDTRLARCLFGFMAGVLTARLWQLTSIRPRGEVPALAGALAAVAFLPAELEPLIVPLFAWVVLVYASDDGIVSQALHKNFPQMLGRVSYSIYMTHYIVSLTIQALLAMFTNLTSEVDGDMIITGPWWFGDMLTLAYLAIVVGVSCITYAWIEKPGRAWFNQKAEPVPAAW